MNLPCVPIRRILHLITLVIFEKCAIYGGSY
jgi:hypothetical protein